MFKETPDSEENKKTVAAYQHFLETIQTLRAPGGCPWDRNQTPLSMRQDLIEETFEAVDAISQQDFDHVKEELGDVMLNATMISYMYQQNGDFSIADSLNELAEKLVRRHPHVWPQSEGASQANGKVKNAEEVLNQWDLIKQNVEGRKTTSVLDEVPLSFPPLLRAFKMLKKAAKKGFEWQNHNQAAIKVQEEFDEVKQAYAQLEQILQQKDNHPLTLHSSTQADNSQLHVEEEIGDLLLAVVNYARQLGVDPETALNRANAKFYSRFTYIEEQMQKSGIPMDKDHTREQIEFWNEAKTNGK